MTFFVCFHQKNVRKGVKVPFSKVSGSKFQKLLSLKKCLINLGPWTKLWNISKCEIFPNLQVYNAIFPWQLAHRPLNYTKLIDFSFLSSNWEILAALICMTLLMPDVQRKIFHDHYTSRTRASKLRKFQCICEKTRETNKEKAQNKLKISNCFCAIVRWKLIADLV